MNKLTIMVGLSASGKSTVANKLSSETGAIIVSTDFIRGELGDVIDQSNNEQVFKLFHSRIKENLLNGLDVIADATNISMKSRRAILEYVKKIDCIKEAYIVAKNVDKCIEDNIYKEYYKYKGYSRYRLQNEMSGLFKAVLRHNLMDELFPIKENIFVCMNELNIQ